MHHTIYFIDIDWHWLIISDLSGFNIYLSYELIFFLELNRLCNSSCILVTAFDRIIPLDYNNNSAFSVMSTLSYAEAVDYHYELGYMFWSDIREGNIKRSNMDGTNIKVIHKEGDGYGLAVEWNPLQLYWTNIINRSISVSDLEGKNRRVLNCSNIDEPFGIVFDPHEG